MIKAIIFDMGGVILFPGRLSEVAREYEKLFNLTEEVFYPVFRKYWHLWRVGDVTEDQFWDNIFQELNMEFNDRAKLKKIIRDNQRPDNQIVEIVKQLKKNYKVYGLTNHAREWFEWIVENFRLDELFDFIQTSYDSKDAKPEEKMYKDLLKKINLKPEECIYIDDKEENVVTARHLGFHAFRFIDFDTLKNDLDKIGIKVM